MKENNISRFENAETPEDLFPFLGPITDEEDGFPAKCIPEFCAAKPFVEFQVLPLDPQIERALCDLPESGEEREDAIAEVEWLAEFLYDIPEHFMACFFPSPKTGAMELWIYERTREFQWEVA